jgi:midasin
VCAPSSLQGPTSAGKTSLVEYVAIQTGHRFVRLNNHEHTDLQEYLGRYVTDASGKLVFMEGALVQAVRQVSSHCFCPLSSGRFVWADLCG